MNEHDSQTELLSTPGEGPHTVHTRGTPVSSHRQPGLVHELGIDSPRETMNFLNFHFCHVDTSNILSGGLPRSARSPHSRYSKVFLNVKDRLPEEEEAGTRVA